MEQDRDQKFMCASCGSEWTLEYLEENVWQCGDCSMPITGGSSDLAYESNTMSVKLQAAEGVMKAAEKVFAAHDLSNRHGLGPAIEEMRARWIAAGASVVIASLVDGESYEGEEEEFIPWTFDVSDLPATNELQRFDAVCALVKGWTQSGRVITVVEHYEDDDYAPDGKDYCGGTYRVIWEGKTYEYAISENMGLERMELIGSPLPGTVAVSS